ncbi:MAG: nitrite reductase small subunit NirD [Granulosicoccus sp.]
MTEQVIEWLDIGRRNDIPQQGARRIFMGNRTVAVFRTATNEFFALEDKCPHAGGPLSEGIVHGDCVTCPLHNWVISLKSGTAQGADQGNVRRYKTRVEGERLLLATDA